MSEPLIFQQVERRRDLSREEFIECYQRKNRPVVIEGVGESWKERWTPEMLKERFGDREIQAETGHLFKNDRKKKTMTLAEIVDLSMSASLEYRVRSFSFFSQVQELMDEYKANNFCEHLLERSGDLRPVFWISPPGNSTVLHNDTFYENLNVQVYGHKRFILMPPSNYKYMHPHFLSESPINPLKPDYSKFPLFAKAQIQEATLSPGEIFFLPQFWWHYVTALDFTINVNTFMRTTRKSMMYATKGLPIVPKTIYRIYHHEGLGRFIDRSEEKIYSLYSKIAGKKKKKTEEAEAVAAH